MRDFGILYGDEVKQAFKSKKIIVLLAVYLAVLFAGIKLGNLFEPFGSYLALPELPLAFYAVVLLSLILLPILIIVVSYDSIAGELATGSMKYLAYRTSRQTIFLAKYAALLTIISVPTLLFLVGGIFSADPIPWITVLSYALYLLVYAAAFLSLAFLFSVLFKKPQRTLYISLLALIILVILRFTSPYYLSLFWYAHLTPVYLGLTLFALGYGILGLILFWRTDIL